MFLILKLQNIHQALSLARLGAPVGNGASQLTSLPHQPILCLVKQMQQLRKKVHSQADQVYNAAASPSSSSWDCELLSLPHVLNCKTEMVPNSQCYREEEMGQDSMSGPPIAWSARDGANDEEEGNEQEDEQTSCSGALLIRVFCSHCIHHPLQKVQEIGG